MKKCIVVGGGIVGILSALLLKDRYDEVILVEEKDQVGGLLSSTKVDGIPFDYGAHFPNLLSNQRVNELLYGDTDSEGSIWQKFPYLQSENYFNGQWNTTSPLIDARFIPEEIYNKGIVEFLNLPDSDYEIENMGEFLSSAFGETFKKEIFDRVLNKILGEDTDNLDTRALTLLGLNRLVAFDSKITKDLKGIDRYASKLGYNSYKDGAPDAGYLYPKGNDGVGRWTSHLQEKLVENGIKTLTSTTVSSLSCHEGFIDITLSSGKTEIVDKLFWTIPPIFLIKMLNEPVKFDRPKFRTTLLCHFVFDKPIIKKIPHFLLIWDPSKLSYRITLYQNINTGEDKITHNSLTVEIVSDGSIKDQLDNIQDIIKKELVEMNIVSEDTKATHFKYEFLGSSFPVFNKTFSENAKKQKELVEGKYSNIMLLGRGAGNSFSITNCLLEAYDRINQEGL